MTHIVFDCELIGKEKSVFLVCTKEIEKLALDGDVLAIQTIIKENEALRAALTDTLDFVERHSNRWDGVNGKHPMRVVTAARNLLPPNAEYTAPKPEER